MQETYHTMSVKHQNLKQYHLSPIYLLLILPVIDFSTVFMSLMIRETYRSITNQASGEKVHDMTLFLPNQMNNCNNKSQSLN